MNKKQKLFKHLDEHRYATDSDVARIWGGEPNWSTVEEYKRQWQRLANDKEYFADKEILGIEKWGRKHLAELKGGHRYISKLFYEEQKPRFKKDFSKHRFFYKGNELYNIKEAEWSFSGFDLKANWKNKDEDNRECLGYFYLKDLEIFDK